MHKFFGVSGVVAALFSATSAGAADMPLKAPAAPVAAPVSWTGFYLGGNIGWMGLNSSVSFPDQFAIDQLTNTITPNALRGLGPTGTILVVVPGTSRTVPDFDARGDAFTGGGQLGFNWQFNRVVVGVEGDFNATSSKNNTGTFNIALPATALTTGAAVSINRRFETDWMASIRGRLGFTAGGRGEFLIYGTGGVAFTEMSITGSDTYMPIPIPGLVEAGLSPATQFQGNRTTGSADSQTLIGGTWGGGVEWAFWNNLSVGAEYRHTQFGWRTATYNFVLPIFPCCAPGGVNPPNSLSSKLTADQVTVRLNWRFSALGR